MLKSELMEKASDYYLQERAFLYLVNKKAWMKLIEDLMNWSK